MLVRCSGSNLIIRNRRLPKEDRAMSPRLRIGIDLGGTKIEGAAVDVSGSVRVRRRAATPAQNYRATIEVIVALIGAIEREIGATASVGIGIPGAVSPTTGLVKNANSTWLIGRPLQRDLETALGRPARLANDANCFALSEATDGAGASKETVFGVILGTGVGGGLAVRRRILVGANAIAGEWGHNPLPWPAPDETPGPRCYCGRSGCLESFLSGPALVADHRRHSGQSLSAPEIVEAAKGGDPECRATLGRYMDRLARGLASVINLIDPDAIVLGGGLSGISELYDQVPLLWTRYIFSDQVVTPLFPPVHGDSSGVRGAAWLWRADEKP
jgi:fructokinase